MNFSRKSTVGWSIGNILLDLAGGVLNFGQMGVQSIDQSKLYSFFFISFFPPCIGNLHL
jgi:cystinosin